MGWLVCQVSVVFSDPPGPLVEEVWSVESGLKLPLYAVFMSKLRLNTNWSIFVDMCFFVAAGKNSSYLLTILVVPLLLKISQGVGLVKK